MTFEKYLQEKCLKDNYEDKSFIFWLSHQSKTQLISYAQEWGDMLLETQPK